MLNKKKKVVTTNDHIQSAQAGYESAVQLFQNARNQIDTATGTLLLTEDSIDKQVEELLAQKAEINAQKERNSKFAAKIDEFLS